jgi:YidC/Oxa1 family membrane protein insertase
LNPKPKGGQYDRFGGSVSPKYPDEWKILVGRDDEKEEWCSILSKSNQNEFYASHLSIKGALDGERLVPIDTIPQSYLNYKDLTGVIESIYAFGSKPVKLKQIFSESGFPFCLKMRIVLKNEGKELVSFSESDSVVFLLGPGLGKIDESIKQKEPSLYHYVEPIAFCNGKIYNENAKSHMHNPLHWACNSLQWAGIHNRYFALLILPGNFKSTINALPFSQAYISYETDLDGQLLLHDLPMLFLKLPISSLQARETLSWDFLIFAGPKSIDVLKFGDKNLSVLLFPDLWSWMRWLCLGLYRLLLVIHLVIPSWGWSIIILALVVRVCLFPIARRAQRSQNRFINVQKQMLPELREIKSKYRGGEKSEQILQLYKKYEVSPFAGLKPLFVVLIQLPILIALYYVLGAVFELRNAHFIWIETLAEPDHLFSLGFNIPYLSGYFNLLPILMAVVTLIAFKLSPAPTVEKKDLRLQNVFLVAMTVLFFFLFYNFPAGMVLYWTFANVFQIAQQRLLKGV